MKAQGSMETLLVISVVLVIFSIILSLAISKQLESEKIKTALEKTNACDAFADEVKSVFVLGNGTKSSIKIDYNITISDRTAIVDSVICKLCCNVTKNSSSTYTIPSGVTKLENIGSNIFLAPPKLVSAAKYSKPDHVFVSDETNKVTADDGTHAHVDKESRILHVVFDIPVTKITAIIRCHDDGTIELKNEGLGSLISNMSCEKNIWTWVNQTANGNIFDANSGNTDFDYEFIDAIW